MPNLGHNLELDRCPHCYVDKPNLNRLWTNNTTAYNGSNQRFWSCYQCQRCGGVVTAFSYKSADSHAEEIYPTAPEVDSAIPDRARSYLSQALLSLSAPAGAVMLAASAVDAMLKAKGYKDGSLYKRIEQAAKDHLITEDMAKWAHEVRLDANDQRHADEDAELPTEADARHSIDFTQALGTFLFTLPARVRRGLKEATSTAKPDPEAK